jgi:hypothetical protein
VKAVFRTSFAVLLAPAIFAGCGTGTTIGRPIVGPTAAPTSVPTGGSPTTAPTTAPTTVRTTAPTTAPTGAPTTAPTAAPTGTPISGTTPQPGNSAPVDHPADNGDVFAFTGSITTTYARPNQTPSPEPTQTAFDNVAQTITVSNPATFNGNSAVDFHTAETDTQTAPASQTFSDTLDDYFQFSNSIYTGDFTNLGYTSTDDTGYAVTFTYGTGNGLADELPELAGASWTNNAAATIATTSTDNESSTMTVKSDGSYTQTIQYQNVNAQGATDYSTANSNLDGSGLYTTPRLGTDFSSDYTYAVASPSAGTISETTTIPVAPMSTATPEVVSTTVPNWIPAGVLGVALATETDMDGGSTAFPSACPVPVSFGTAGNKLVQTKQRVDPLFGELENDVVTTYVIPNVGPACVTILDTLSNYYDFSGQNGTGYFSGSPQQITTVSEVLYLTSEQLMSAARKPQLRASLQRNFALRVTTAQARISVARIEQRDRMLRSFSTPAHGHGRAFATHRGIL